LPETLLESELFGYVEGAFTGARRKGKPGLFELAHHGTIFLDEISEIPLSLQGRLLRVLQERQVIRLGHDRVIPIDVRVLCATNRYLKGLVEEGRFRGDLYWRLNVLNLFIAPLRDRRSDILPLARLFLEALSPEGRSRIVFTAGAIRFLTGYRWPGNVRELRNLCERLALGHTRNVVDEEFVKLAMEYRAEARPVPAKHPDMEDIERALLESGGRVGGAARLLGIHRATVWRRRRRAAQKGEGPKARKKERRI
jgi:transcriptional regulator with PAS, ATPase and Fis domain